MKDVLNKLSIPENSQKEADAKLNTIESKEEM